MAFIARLLAVAWAVFWLFFLVAESLAWCTPTLVTAVWAGVGLRFVILPLVPWRRKSTEAFCLWSPGC